ncbi:lanthionine synthetase LanC family protein [Alteraurantiacibacter aquimixticola]|uniref:Uncharacterized protein n=1 Tax=Alteraurantiacibacter aquimixticola TaxID=2489173 RepID=A0A4T3EYT8_9SPHN|nr:lanthionine synthetase LanC family protein [Alteraurantiacibacter aquimixticola]TIX49816.1 hypothetical protein E5222_13500 [Alteraurantiacibacter aquimixticola]
MYWEFRNASRFSWVFSAIERNANPQKPGFSHGTAGIADALVRLYQATQDEVFLETAEAGFRHEQHWFDPVAKNWPDLRESLADSATLRARDYSVYWCHGAPGILLARLNAHAATGNGDYLRQARAALSTLCAHFYAPATDVDLESLCLYHGLVGNADIALTAQRASMSTDCELDQIFNAARHAISGLVGKLVATGRTANVLDRVGLMTGVAGLGWFCLRLIDSNTPSVLNCLSNDR